MQPNFKSATIKFVWKWEMRQAPLTTCYWKMFSKRWIRIVLMCSVYTYGEFVYKITNHNAATSIVARVKIENSDPFITLITTFDNIMQCHMSIVIVFVPAVENLWCFFFFIFLCCVVLFFRFPFLFFFLLIWLFQLKLKCHFNSYALFINQVEAYFRDMIDAIYTRFLKGRMS